MQQSSPEEIPQFKFARTFQTRILALMYQNYDFLIMAHDMVIPDYFSDEVLQWYFCKLRDYYLDYQMRMGADALRNELAKACTAHPPKITPNTVKMFSDVYQLLQEPIKDKDYIINEVATFCKHQAIKAAVLEAPQLLQSEQFDAIEQLIRDAVAVGSHTMDVGSQYFIDWPERLRKRHRVHETGTIPTGITLLDSCMGGGLKVKQLGMWMAPVGRGKSVALNQCGRRAIVVKKVVFHYSLELSVEAIAERYDASFARVPVNDLTDHEAKLARKMDNLGRRWGNSLLIKEYAPKSASVATIRAHMMQCMGMGLKPDLVLVDYVDLLKPSIRYKEKRDELTATCEELRALAVDLVVPVWTATQSTRAAISAEVHGEEHVSEDINKVNIADVVITINQMKKEVDENTVRLFVAKNRNGPKYKLFKISTDFEKMIFYSPCKVDNT